MIKDKNEQTKMFEPWIKKYNLQVIGKEECGNFEHSETEQFFNEIVKEDIKRETFEAHIKVVRATEDSNSAKWDEYEAIWREILGY